MTVCGVAAYTQPACPYPAGADTKLFEGNVFGNEIEIAFPRALDDLIALNPMTSELLAVVVTLGMA